MGAILGSVCVGLVGAKEIRLCLLGTFSSSGELEFGTTESLRMTRTV